jgi:hypothetical protein
MTKKPGLMNQGGQLILEAVLIIVMLTAFTGMTIRYFKDNELVKSLISGPWQNLAGMLQNGVWAPPATGAAIHPNSHNRGVVITGEEAR